MSVRAWIVLVAMVVWVCEADAVIVDSFDTFQALTADAGDPAPASEVIGPEILGGKRKMLPYWASGPNSVDAVVNGDGNGVLSFSEGADTVGHLSVSWGGAGTTIVEGADLTAEGALDRFQVGLLSSDSSAQLTLRAWGYNMGIADCTVTLPGDSSVPTHVDLRFSGFVVRREPMVDFSEVVMLAMYIVPDQPGASIQLESVETTVPEPATLLLTLAGLIVFAKRR